MNPLTDLPMGFGMALIQNPDALRYFESLDESQKKAIINETHAINSKQQMQQFVESLGQSSFFRLTYIRRAFAQTYNRRKRRIRF